MIKVQPAGSRLVKTETPDRLVITYPPKGILSVGAVLIAVGAAALTLVLSLLPAAFRSGESGFVVGAFVGLIPGLVMLLGGFADALKTWSVSRTAEWVTFTRGGLWGKRSRKWHTQDVTTFWVSLYQGGQAGQRCALILCFNNGRSEDLVEGLGMEEDFRWIVALMKNKKGAVKATPPTARVAAEPVVRRVDPSVVPVSIVSRRFPTGGVEMTFLPLIGFKRRWWKLLGVVVGGLVVILAFGTLIGSRNAVWISRVAVAALLLGVFVRYLILSRSAVVFIDNGLVTIAQNQHQGSHQLPVEEIEFVQTFRNGGVSELQFLLRGKPKVRLLHGRPADELEWAARFLRVALKHRPEEEAAPMKVDAAVGQCQVCSETMETRVVYCGKCRTPHHEECWSYVGTCSTYGCREIRFTRT